MGDIIKLRTDTAANFKSKNPVLEYGEKGHERDTGKEKVGNGNDNWNQLDYITKSIEDEIGRMRTDISSGGLPTYTFRGKGVPAIPPTQYKAYYVHIIVLPDRVQTIQIPNNTPDGCIFALENNDRDNYVTVYPPAGETINGSSSSFQSKPYTLSYFVKDGTNWSEAFGGVFPNNMDSFRSTVEVLLNGKLHTMDEIAAQFKDRFHTFHEIQTEFDAQLHTLDALRQAGFIQRECDYGIYALTTVPTDRAWVIGTESMDSPFTIRVDASEHLLLLMPAVVASFISKILVDGAEAEFNMHDFPASGSDGTQKLLITNDPVPANTDLKIWFEWGVDYSALTSDGIEIDDGTSDAAGIKKLNIKGMKLTEVPNSGGMAGDEAELTAGVNIHMMAPNQQYGSALANEITILPPLNVYDDPDATGAEGVKLEIKPDAFEPMHKPSYLAYLKDSVDVVGKLPQGFETTAGAHHNGALWFDDIVCPAGAYIETRRDDKEWGIQEADELDPNVSGGTDYLIAVRIHMRGKAPSDGFVRLYLYNKSVDPFSPTGYMVDTNGQPMAVERHYKNEQELGILDVIGVVNAKGLQEFSVHVVDSFSNDIIEITDRTEGASGIMIQALSSEEKTGHGLLQFESDTNQNIEFSSHYLGDDRMTIDYMASRPEAPVAYTGGTNWISVDGMRLINPNGIKVGVVDGHVHIQDDGTHICDFNFGKIFTSEETQMLRGKDIHVTATLVDKNAGFRVGLMKWTGTPDEFTPEIFTTRNGGGALIFQTGWSQSDSLFISEDVVSGDHTLSKVFTVPTDANNYAIVIYPIEAQEPITLKLKQLKVDVSPAFIGYSLHAPELLNELHLELSDEHKKFVQDTQGYAALRYTINNAAQGLPMPLGMLKSGNALVSLDPSANKIAGSQAKGGEGALLFNADGQAKITTTVRLWNEQGSDNTATFWWAEVSPDGNTYTKFPDSEFTFNVPANSKETLHRFEYAHDFEEHDRIALRASANKADGAFLNCVSDSRPMVEVDVEYKALTADSGDDPSATLDATRAARVTLGDKIYYAGFKGSHEFASNSSVDIIFEDLPDDAIPHVVKAYKKRSDGKVQSTARVEELYDPATSKLTVSFGETAETIVIYEVLA